MERIIQLLKQYRYGVLVLFIGLALMLIPGEGSAAEEADTVSSDPGVSVQEQLEDILSQIDGAGRVRLMLTESAGASTVYQQNTNTSGESLKEETVIVTDGSRVENGLIVQVIPARYQGAVVVCQGGDRAAVRLAIVEAISSVTGLTSDKITVLKMK